MCNSRRIRKFTMHGVLLVGALMFATASTAHASGWTGTVAQLWCGPGASNVCFVKLNGSRDALPSCVNDIYGEGMAFSYNNGGIFQMLMAAKLAGLTVTIAGTTYCTLQNDSNTGGNRVEDVWWVRF